MIILVFISTVQFSLERPMFFILLWLVGKTFSYFFVVVAFFQFLALSRAIMRRNWYCFRSNGWGLHVSIIRFLQGIESLYKQQEHIIANHRCSAWIFHLISWLEFLVSLFSNRWWRRWSRRNSFIERIVMQLMTKRMSPLLFCRAQQTKLNNKIRGKTRSWVRRCFKKGFD